MPRWILSGYYQVLRFNQDREAAVGMVLVVLVKNARLKDYVNTIGWDLVLNLIKTNPEIAGDIAPGALTEINMYQAAA